MQQQHASGYRHIATLSIGVLCLIASNAGFAKEVNAKSVMKSVNSAYQAFLSSGVTRHIRLSNQTEMRRKGAPDVKSSSISLIQQQGKKARMQTVSSQVHLKSNPDLGVRGYSGPGHQELVWVHDGSTTKVRYAAPNTSGLSASAKGGAPVVKEFVIDHSKLKGLKADFSDPLGSSEIPQVMLKHPFVASNDVLDGKPAILLDSQTPVAINKDNKATVRFWVNPDDYTVSRIEMSGTYSGEGGPYHYDNIIEADYTAPVQALGGVEPFSLKLGKDAEDLTDMAAKYAR